MSKVLKAVKELFKRKRIFQALVKLELRSWWQLLAFEEEQKSQCRWKRVEETRKSWGDVMGFWVIVRILYFVLRRWRFAGFLKKSSMIQSTFILA